MSLSYTMSFNPPIAQLVEHSPLKRRVLGSSPSGRTCVNKTASGRLVRFRAYYTHAGVAKWYTRLP